MDKPVPSDEALKGCYSPTGLPTTDCCSLYKSSWEEIEKRLTDRLHGGRCAEEPAVRAVVENIAPLQVFDGGIVRHGIEHRAQHFFCKCKLLR